MPVSRNTILWLCAALVAPALMTTGCGDSGHPLVDLRGTITFNGGPPPESGSVMFSPISKDRPEGIPSRPAAAPFGKDGKFRATTWKKNDGILPGKYTVRVYCMDPGQDLVGPQDDTSLVPDGWQPEDVVVQEGEGAITVDLDVPQKN